MAATQYEVFELDGVEVKLSSPDKVYFPACGVTKGQLAHFYVECADAILNHLRERPTMLKRFPGGIEAKPIYQKRVPAKRPEWLQTAVLKFPSGREAEELVPVDAAHLVWAVSLGNVDWNPHPVRRADLDHPDELRVDIDPMPGAPWDACAASRCSSREVLREHGLRGYPGTSGSRGMHIPVRIHPEWDFVDGAPRRARARARGGAPRRGAGDLEVVEGGAPAGRGLRRLQPERQGPHGRGAATRCARCPTRAVGCALRWDEVADVEPGDLRIDTVPERLRDGRGPGADIDAHAGVAGRLLELARRDEHDRGLEDAPWPPALASSRASPSASSPAAPARALTTTDTSVSHRPYLGRWRTIAARGRRHAGGRLRALLQVERRDPRRARRRHPPLQ